MPLHHRSVRVRSVRGDVAVVEHRLALAGFELAVTAKHVAEPPVRHDMYFVGGDAKGSRITERYAPDGASTILEIDAEVRPPLRMALALAARPRRLEEDLGSLADEIARAA